jgi:SAM-dependent methyltransferase
MNAEVIKKGVVEGYGKIAKRPSSQGFLSKMFACCDTGKIVGEVSHKIGYSTEELQAVPEGANMGIGCGNPTALAKIKAGDTVLDLGSGGGFDCFLASPLVGDTGKVIGVDITEEMVNRAKQNAQKGKYKNVDFIKGDIENLPIPDNSVDIIISNCVLNLSTNKAKIFEEANRVLKQDGEMTISDIVLLEELPDFIKKSVEGYVACIAGAEKIENYFLYAQQAGFSNVKIETKTSFPLELLMTDPIAQKIVTDFNLSDEQIKNISNAITSVTLSAKK